MMKQGNQDFVHLHVHSDYSLLDGACRMDRLCKRVQELGMRGIAVTDHGNLFGVPDLVAQSKAHGVKGIIGVEAYVAWDHQHTDKPRREDLRMYHMGLLAMNAEGYRNLSQLMSIAHTKGFYYKPRIDRSLLERYSGGLIALSGCMSGYPSQMLLAEAEDKAVQFLGDLKNLFGPERLFVEVQNHWMEEQKLLVPGLLQLAKKMGLKPVATNDTHYIEQKDWEAHDALLCVQTGAKLHEAERMRFATREFYLKSRAEMALLFGGNEEVLDSTLLIADMCQAKLPYGENHYPVFKLDAEAQEKWGTNAAYLRHLCEKGLHERYGSRAGELKERLDYEFGVIERMGFIDYFLIVADFVNWAKDHGVPVGPGRGSVAGSIVAYVLRITDVDPIRFGLLFERFLNPERVSPPDIDIDFCMRRRDEVIEYVRKRYGEECVANIATFGTFGAKMVMRDLARVNDLPYAEGDRWAKMIPDELGITLEHALEVSSELRNEVDHNALFRKVVKQGMTIEGTVRNVGTHAAGVLISDRPLQDLVPVMLQEGALTTQYSKDPLEELGLLKIDFLGLKTLTVIRDAETLIRSEKPHFRMDQIPLDDRKTFALLDQGRTVGVFQLESSGLQGLCRQFGGIQSVDEMSAISALYRPGPMELIPTYLKGKKDPKSIEYVHPLFEKICKDTYGIMVYQEQVMEAARVIGGYTLGGADILRRAMGKKKVEVMNAQREIFVKGAFETHGMARGKAEEIFALLEKFAGYGFNKSHSDAYALISYQTAYLKANYPVQFMAALLSSELGNAEKIAFFIKECEQLGIQVMGPDVNASLSSFTPMTEREQKRILFGLSAIKGVGDVAAQTIILERQKGGKYSDFYDFAIRVDLRVVNKRVMECLVRSGACDGFGIDRGYLLQSIETVLNRAGREQRDRALGQGSLFDLFVEDGDHSSGHASDWLVKAGGRMSVRERLKGEKELLGFYVTGHPMDEYLGLDRLINTVQAESQLKSLENGNVFRICGVIASILKKMVKKTNAPWLVVTVSSKEASFEVSVFSDVLEESEGVFEEGNVVVLEGVAKRSAGRDDVRLSITRARLLDRALEGLISEYMWLIYPDERGEAFMKLLGEAMHAYEGSAALKIGFCVGEHYAIEGTTHPALKCYFPLKVLRELKAHAGVCRLEVHVKPPQMPQKPARNFGYQRYSED